MTNEIMNADLCNRKADEGLPKISLDECLDVNVATIKTKDLQKYHDRCMAFQLVLNRMIDMNLANLHYLEKAMFKKGIKTSYGQTISKTLVTDFDSAKFRHSPIAGQIIRDLAETDEGMERLINRLFVTLNNINDLAVEHDLLCDSKLDMDEVDKILCDSMSESHPVEYKRGSLIKETKYELSRSNDAFRGQGEQAKELSKRIGVKLWKD